MADITPAKKLFDLLVSRDFDPEMLDSSGKPATDPAETEVFSFNFRAESGKDYGTVVVMLGNENNLEVYCSDNVGKTMEEPDKTEWFDFLEQLKMFAVKNFMEFGIKNLNRLRYSMQGQAAIKEGLLEGWSGNRTTSYSAQATEARLMIRHKKPLGENDARYRYIQSLFIETADGERFKLPFTKLAGGRAMLEHVRHGGRPYDLAGQHITSMVEEINVLSRFRRANHGKIFEGDTQALIAETNSYYENLNRALKHVGTARGYQHYFENWQPAEITEQDIVVESLKDLFVERSIDARVEEALPLLARIQQQGRIMKEANIFEAWINNLAEGTWALPDTPEAQQKLIDLMSKELPVGADATNATEQLYDLVGDDELFDQLGELATKDANADARDLVKLRLQQLDQDPGVRKVLDAINISATATMNPAEPTNPADVDPNKAMAETVKDPRNQTEDPAGTQQPDYAAYQDDLASILKHAGVAAQDNPAPDYEPEVSEDANPGIVVDQELDEINGVLSPINEKDDEQLDEFAPLAAAIGGALGRAAVGATASTIEKGLAGMAGKAMGSAVGDALSDETDEAKCNMSEAGTACSVHGLEECWGLMPTPAAMEEARDPFIARLQTLASIRVQ
jgi:hypothetical protein